MSAPPTYRSKGRSWVKLWVGEWLDGTTRYEMTGAQRAFWIDLLTMAGRSRTPGVVCANSENAGFFGYPLSRYEGILGDPTVNVLETLRLFEAQGKIELLITRQEEPALYAVKIRAWERYQSEYMRQRKTRKGAAKVTPKVTTKNTERCAIEEEGEVDGEGEEENHSPTKTVGVALGSPEFLEFWKAFPRRVDRQEAVRAWVKGLCDGNLGEILIGLERWKQTEQWMDQDKIPYPSTWINKRRWKDAPERKVTKGEQRQSAIDRVRSQIENA